MLLPGWLVGPKALLAVPTLVGLAFSFLAAALAFFHALAFSDRRPPSATPLRDRHVQLLTGAWRSRIRSIRTWLCSSWFWGFRFRRTGQRHTETVFAISFWHLAEAMHCTQQGQLGIWDLKLLRKKKRLENGCGKRACRQRTFHQGIFLASFFPDTSVGNCRCACLYRRAPRTIFLKQRSNFSLRRACVLLLRGFSFII